MAGKIQKLIDTSYEEKGDPDIDALSQKIG